MSICPKLPPLNTLEQNNNNHAFFTNTSYEIYKNDFCENTVIFNGLPIKTNTTLNHNLQQIGFEHITTKDIQQGNIKDLRTYNNSRIERVPWIKYLIEHSCDCENYRCFKNYRNNRERTIIWCVKERYVIILEKRTDSYFLITAYCLIYKKAEEKLEREYNNYLKNQKRLS